MDCNIFDGTNESEFSLKIHECNMYDEVEYKSNGVKSDLDGMY